MRWGRADAVETVLFVAEKPVSRAELARVVGATPKQDETALTELTASYQGTGLRLAHDGDDPRHAGRGARLRTGAPVDAPRAPATPGVWCRGRRLKPRARGIPVPAVCATRPRR